MLRKFLIATIFTGILSACCPGPTQVQRTETAFTANVLAIQSDNQVQVKLEPGAKIYTLLLPTSLTFNALEVGERIYVQGYLAGTAQLEVTTLKSLAQ